MARSGPCDISPWGDRRRLRVGLLGGSFNPAHEGHAHVALAALTRLGLDAVWLLVSPQNPLKSADDMAPLEERWQSCRAICQGHPRLLPLAIESLLGTQYTAHTVAVLKQRFPRITFVWLMGADNLMQIDRWRNWQSIFRSMPVAVVDRPPYSCAALAAKAARRFAHARRSPRALCLSGLPAWTFLHIRRHPASASSIRASARLLSHSPAPNQENAISPSLAPYQATPSFEPSAPVAVFDPLTLVTSSLDDDKGEEIVVIDLKGRSAIGDYMVIATGRSQRQVGAMADHLVERLKSIGVRAVVEGTQTCDWVLIDGGDIIVHLFRPEVRTFYNLEKMWVPAAQADQ